MKMTLRQFIESPGIPATDTYSGGVEILDPYFSCVKDEAYMNRNLHASFMIRLRRKLCFDCGLGHIPIKKEAFDHRFLFWGAPDKDSGVYTWPSLFHRLSKVSESDRFVVMLNATDDTFTQQYADMIPDSIKKIMVTNCDADHPKVQWRPLGRDNNNRKYFDLAPRQDKQQWLYCNFSTATHPVRAQVVQILSEMDHTTVVGIEGYGKWSGYPMDNEAFVHDLNNHRFSACPRGKGYDTFRMWDSLHLGVVPIVVREAKFHEYLSELPILFLDSAEEFGTLTRDYLESVHAEMMETVYDFNVLTASFWTRIFLDGFQDDESH